MLNRVAHISCSIKSRHFVSRLEQITSFRVANIVTFAGKSCRDLGTLMEYLCDKIDNLLASTVLTHCCKYVHVIYDRGGKSDSLNKTSLGVTCKSLNRNP